MHAETADLQTEDWMANCKMSTMIRRARYPSSAGQSQQIA